MAHLGHFTLDLYGFDLWYTNYVIGQEAIDLDYEVSQTQKMKWMKDLHGLMFDNLIDIALWLSNKGGSNEKLKIVEGNKISIGSKKYYIFWWDYRLHTVLDCP